MDQTDYNLRHYLLLQLKEIAEHRWYLGESRKREVSFDEAIEDWVNKQINSLGLTHNKRFRSHYFNRLSEIENFMEEHERMGDLQDILTTEKVHELLED